MKYNRFFSLLASLLIATQGIAVGGDLQSPTSPLSERSENGTRFSPPSEGPGEVDPFGEVDVAKYPNTMTITGYVRLGDEVLDSTAVVAVYQGDVLRGKKSPADNGKYVSILMLTIYGETKGQALHFKVWTGGRVIEVDQGLTFSSDARVGKAKDPYYIDLPVPVVTTPTTEGWATTCLPYNALVPEGVTVWNATGIADGELVMEIMEAAGGDLQSVGGDLQSPTIIPANTPVLLQSNGLESYEWLARVADGDVKAEGSILRGTTEPTAVEANSVLTLGHSDTTGEVGFWLYTGTVVPANRAYIADFPAATRGVTLDSSGTVTSVLRWREFAIPDPAGDGLPADTDNCFDLQGRKVPADKAGKLLWKKGKHGQTIKIR